VVSGVSNGIAQHAEAMSGARALGTVGYVVGIVVAGLGVHRVLWFGGSRRPPWIRAALTALVTVPVFAAPALVLAMLMTLFQLRFAT
jgi:hypothetical protein